MKIPTRQRALSMFGGPLGVLGLLIVALSAMAYYGEWWWMFDIAANFRAQLAIVGLGVLFGAAALRTRAVMLVGLVIMALNLAPIVQLYRGPGGVDVEPEFRVASYNLLQSASEERLEVVEWLRTVDADVVFLQEASARWTNFIERSELPWKVIAPRTRGRQRYGTLSLVPDDAEVDFIDMLFRPTPAVTLEVGGEPITILGVHALSPYSGERAEIRDAGFLDLAEWVSAQENQVVVAGDFNSTPFSWSYRRLLEVSGLNNSLDGFGLQPTWPTNNIFLRIPIDHLLYSDGLVVVDRQVRESFGSDHFPIVVDLAIGK